jgi:hypothetical protein
VENVSWEVSAGSGAAAAAANPLQKSKDNSQAAGAQARAQRSIFDKTSYSTLCGVVLLPLHGSGG